MLLFKIIKSYILTQKEEDSLTISEEIYKLDNISDFLGSEILYEGKIGIKKDCITYGELLDFIHFNNNHNNIQAHLLKCKMCNEEYNKIVKNSTSLSKSIKKKMTN